MTPNQVKRSKQGTMTDLLSCLAVFNGNAKERQKLTFDEIMRLD